MKILFALVSVLCLGSSAMAQTTRPSTRPADAPAEDVLNRMLKPAGQAPQVLQPITLPSAIDTTTGAGAVAPTAPPMKVIREGTFIVDRTGRLTKSPDGLLAQFTFDTDGKALQDPPVIISPNLKLEQMEQAVSDANRDLRFRVTGMVSEYHGRNYVLLEKVVVVPDVIQQF